MEEETQPLIADSADRDTPMPSAAPETMEPSPRDKAFESFKKKLIDHREYDNKLKNRTTWRRHSVTL